MTKLLSMMGNSANNFYLKSEGEDISGLLEVSLLLCLQQLLVLLHTCIC